MSRTPLARSPSVVYAWGLVEKNRKRINTESTEFAEDSEKRRVILE
jgi:hypothetical protein